LRPQRDAADKDIERQVAILVLIGPIMPAFLHPMQPMPHRVQVHYDLLRVLGQTAHSHL
jgi:hypothetical protein